MIKKRAVSKNFLETARFCYTVIRLCRRLCGCCRISSGLLLAMVCQRLLVGFDHLLERVTRTTFEFFQIPRGHFTGKKFDLQVNFVGAVAFSVIGFFYVKNRGKGKLAASLIPIVLDPEDESEKEMQDSAENREPNGE